MRHPMGLRHPVLEREKHTDKEKQTCRSLFAKEPLIIGLFGGK